MKAVLISILILSAGCAGKWVKVGATEQDRTHDKYECKRDAYNGSSAIQGTGANTYAWADIYVDCMKAKGWSK